jgi:lipid II:glycine glycyltransferase (peptidoglycan interpeptide bridge formation enzyme)
MNKLLVAKYNNRIIALSIICFFNNTATYLHGGSSNQNRNVMAPFLLQWQAIKKAKEQGCVYYDFYGIDEKKWPGVTRFKKGFNGQNINYIGTFDLIYSPVYYWIYKIARFIRRLI